MKLLPRVTMIGSTTGGGSGMPFNSGTAVRLGCKVLGLLGA